jgi:hypothetical protein
MCRKICSALRISVFICAAGVLISGMNQAQTAASNKAPFWTPLKNQPSFAAAHTLLLTDGTVLCQSVLSSDWNRLIPDAKGSYVNGTWTQIASMPPGYGPLYYASAVLADGRVVVMGGEYNLNDNNGNGVWSKLGAIYDPEKNEWLPLEAPFGWDSIGDAQSVVLPDGQWMLASCCTGDGRQAAVLNPSTLAWRYLSSHGKADGNDEEGWTLLPDGTVLAVDVGDVPNAERYFPSSDVWMSAGNTPAPLTDSSSSEVGPAVLRPNGTVFYTGVCAKEADSSQCEGPAHTAIYTPPARQWDTGTWRAGPDFPDGLDISDGPASILPNGHVLMMTSPGIFGIGSVFFEYDGDDLRRVPGPPRASADAAYYGNMLVLPTGQVMLTDFSNDIEIYTPDGVHHHDWEPSIHEAPIFMKRESTYKISGAQFNGVSDGAAYGDDAQSSTNYPLVRVTNLRTHDVSYWKTHDHSTMGVATGRARVSTYFDVPAEADDGVYLLSVVANGIASNPRAVVLQSHRH